MDRGEINYSSLSKWVMMIFAPLVVAGGIYVTTIMEKNAHLDAKVAGLEKQLDKVAAERDDLNDRLKHLVFVRMETK